MLKNIIIQAGKSVKTLSRYLDCVSLSRKKRIKARESIKLFFLSKKIETFKLGITYSLFDGEELLEASLQSVRSSAHYINVVYQSTSWHGEPVEACLYDLLLSFKEKKLIDEIIFFEPDALKTSIDNELFKRNIGVQAVRKAKCNYLLVMDVDEFYHAEEIQWAKEKILKHNYDTTFCFHRNYVNTPQYQQKEIANYAIPFISQLTSQRRLCTQSNAPIVVDPTRCLNHIKHPYIFMYDVVVCHHMSWVRKNLLKKFRNATNTIKEGTEYIYADAVIDEKVFEILGLTKQKEDFNIVPNIFNISF